MNVRRVFTAVAAPFLCLAAQPAQAQSSPAAAPAGQQLPGPPATTAPAQPEDHSAFRLIPEETLARGSSAMIRSWTVDGNAEVGFGRFTVPNTARPRTHTERMGTGMELETRRIAGAGMHLRF